MEDVIPIPSGWRMVYIGEVIQQGDLFCDFSSARVTHERIAAEAKAIWFRNGQQTGKDKENWITAENKLLGEYWKPHTHLVGERYWAGRLTITKSHNAQSTLSVPTIPTFSVKSAKNKVSEYLEKFVKKT